MQLRSGLNSVWVAAFVLLLVNSAYLAATASPTLFYFTNVVLHMALGLVLGLVWVRRVRQGRAAANASERLAAAPGPFVLPAIVLGLGGLAGVAIMVVGAAGKTRWLLPAHIGLIVAGGACSPGRRGSACARRTPTASSRWAAPTPWS